MHRDELPALLEHAREYVCLASVWMITDDWTAACVSRDRVFEQDLLLSEFSPYSEPPSHPRYRDWCGRAIKATEFEGWQRRGLNTVFLICSAALSLQHAVFWYLNAASQSADVDSFLLRMECTWLCKIYSIAKPPIDLSVEDDGAPF
jgi:hypothetical protein